MPSRLLVARPRAPLRPPGATALGGNGQRRSESAATPHGKVGIGATGKTIRDGRARAEERSALQRLTGNCAEYVCDGRYFSSPTPHGLICEPVAHQRKPLPPGVTVVRRSTKAAAGHQLKEVSTTASAGLSRRARDRRRLTCREAARRAESKAGRSKEA